MSKSLIIEHICLMLKHLDNTGIRAVYMVVKELYEMAQTLHRKE